MSCIPKIIEFNKKFVESKQYEAYATPKFPDKKIAIVSCMDARLIEILPAALNLKNGDAKIIKTAGAIISHPFGSVMRSLLIAIYSLGVEEILVIGHHDCGMQGFCLERLVAKMTERGIATQTLDTIRNSGVDLNKWLKGFDSAEDSVRETVNNIKKHPLIPSGISVHGFIIDPSTGKLDSIPTP